jgi:orotate phosphoribosyltransferase
MHENLAEQVVAELAQKKEKATTQWELVRAFINDRCIHRVPPASKEIIAYENSSHYYEWQFYLREVCLEPVCLSLFAETFWRNFADRFKAKPFQIATVEQAGVPLLTSALLAGMVRRIPVHAFTIRKDYKAYGIGNIIEGRPLNLPVLFIDDLTSPTHNTFWHFVRVLKRFGLAVYPWACVLVRKQRRNEPREIITSFGPVMVESLFCLDDFNMTLADYQRYGNEKKKKANGGG